MKLLRKLKKSNFFSNISADPEKYSYPKVLRLVKKDKIIITKLSKENISNLIIKNELNEKIKKIMPKLDMGKESILKKGKGLDDINDLELENNINLSEIVKNSDYSKLSNLEKANLKIKTKETKEESDTIFDNDNNINYESGNRSFTISDFFCQSDSGY